MQQDQQQCPWTAAAYTLQGIRDRARESAKGASQIVSRAGGGHKGTAAVATELVDFHVKIEDTLGWLIDFCIIAAGNPSFAQKVGHEYRARCAEMAALMAPEISGSRELGAGYLPNTQQAAASR